MLVVTWKIRLICGYVRMLGILSGNDFEGYFGGYHVCAEWDDQDSVRN